MTTSHPHAFTSYTLQTWDGQKLLHEIPGLSIDAAREVGRANAPTGLTCRAWADSCDYTEVYCADGSERRGPFAETTLVRIQS